MKIILLALSIIFLTTINAQEKTMSFSLDEAIKFALENSYNTKSAKNEINSAKEKVWETTTIGLPQINARVDYQNFLKQPVSLLPAAAFDNKVPGCPVFDYLYHHPICGYIQQ